MMATEYLDKKHIDYDMTEHHTALTAHDLAIEEHVSEQEVAKSIVIKGDGVFYLCVLPGCYRVDLKSLKRLMNFKSIRLATEDELLELFPDCDLGAEPAIGSMYGLPTLMDERLEEDDNIVFQGGTHEKAIWMSLEDFKIIADPTVLKFSMPSNWDKMDALFNDPFYYDTFFYDPFYPL